MDSTMSKCLHLESEFSCNQRRNDKILFLFFKTFRVETMRTQVMAQLLKKLLSQEDVFQKGGKRFRLQLQVRLIEHFLFISERVTRDC